MYIIYTDLDGTLLTYENYSFSKAKPALSLARKKKVPLILCTSKTRAETGLYQKRLGIKEPFIVENGSAIFIPKNYFDFSFNSKKTKKYDIIEFGMPVKKLRKILKHIGKKTKSKIIGFGDISFRQIADECNLSLNDAKLAKKRDYTEPFKIKGSMDKVIRLIKKYKLNYTRSTRYHYIMGNNDKGKAVKVLSKLLKKKYKSITTIGIGDSLNDLAMFKAVDKPFLVKKHNGKFEDIKLKNLKRINYKGPSGWNKIVIDLLN